MNILAEIDLLKFGARTRFQKPPIYLEPELYFSLPLEVSFSRRNAGSLSSGPSEAALHGSQITQLWLAIRGRSHAATQQRGHQIHPSAAQDHFLLLQTGNIFTKIFFVFLEN